MSYVDEKVPPKREDRLGTCTAFGGSLCELKQRSGSGCCMVDDDRAFRQGSICQLAPGMSILSTIPDSVIIVHGAIGCGGTSHMLNASVRSHQGVTDPNPPGVLWLSTGLNERDVVTGGEQKLEAAILESDKRYRPSAIVVVSTCVPGVIGDDVDGIVDRLRDHVTAPILPVHCEGFKTKVMATAYDAIYHAVARNLVQEPEREFSTVDGDVERELERIRRSKLVNLMNVSSMGDDDFNELSRLVRTLGLDVNLFPVFTHPESFQYATEAALSVAACPTHDDYFLTWLEERWGVPYILKHMPIGIAATSDWIRDIAAFFGLEDAAERFIATETAELERALAPIRERLAGKRAVLSAGEVRTFATASYLQELGMEVAAVRPYHWDRFGEPALERLVRVDPDMTVDVATVQPYEASNIVKAEKPDLYIGHSADNVWAARLGAPVLPIYGGPYAYVGFAGAWDIARRIDRILRNPSFNRHLSENVESAYREDWYAADPFSLIQTESEVA